MAKALSVDLRHRVVAAIVEGMSRRQAAARFGVSAASAVRWHQRFTASGTVAPSRQGGDRRSGRIEAYSEVILGLVTETPDMTLAELQERLKERTVSAGIERYSRGDRDRRCDPALPAALLSGFQPDRARLRQVEGAASRRGNTHYPGSLGRHSRRHRPVHTRRMQKLLRRCRI